MDKRLSEKDQKALLNALEKVKEDKQRMDTKENEKRWADIELPLTLASGLTKLTKTELTPIRVNWGMKGASSLKKQELVDALVQQAADLLPNILNKLDETRFKILKHIADRGGQAFMPLESCQLDYFKNRGLLFTGTSNGKKTLAMPLEITEVFQQMDSPSYRETVRRNTEWIKLTHGMLYYYGTLALEELETLMEPHAAVKLSLHDYTLVLEDSRTYYENFKLDGSGYSNIRVWDAKRVKQEHRTRSELSFYPFTKTQLLQAGDPKFVDRNPSYTAFADFIRNNYNISSEDADSLVEECVYAIRIGEAPGQLFQFLQSQLEIDSLDLTKAFMDFITILNNHTRQWFIKGYYPTELSDRSEKPAVLLQASKAEIIDFAAKKKVGRNDPCPCGSGKKYKKCCAG